MPTSPKPRKESPDEWLRKVEAAHPAVRLPGYWSTIAENSSRWAEELSVGPLWTSAKGQLDRWRHDYRAETGAELLIQPGLPKFVSKTSDSIRDKVLRLCARREDHLEKAIARKGPPIPQIGDLVRTRIAC